MRKVFLKRVGRGGSTIRFLSRFGFHAQLSAIHFKNNTLFKAAEKGCQLKNGWEVRPPRDHNLLDRHRLPVHNRLN
jgi:hypothetical protein